MASIERMTDIVSYTLRNHPEVASIHRFAIGQDELVVTHTDKSRFLIIVVKESEES